MGELRQERGEAYEELRRKIAEAWGREVPDREDPAYAEMVSWLLQNRPDLLSELYAYEGMPEESRLQYEAREAARTLKKRLVYEEDERGRPFLSKEKVGTLLQAGGVLLLFLVVGWFILAPRLASGPREGTGAPPPSSPASASQPTPPEELPSPIAPPEEPAPQSPGPQAPASQSPPLSSPPEPPELPPLPATGTASPPPPAAAPRPAVPRGGAVLEEEKEVAGGAAFVSSVASGAGAFGEAATGGGAFLYQPAPGGGVFAEARPQGEGEEGVSQGGIPSQSPPPPTSFPTAPVSSAAATQGRALCPSGRFESGVLETKVVLVAGEEVPVVVRAGEKVFLGRARLGPSGRVEARLEQAVVEEQVGTVNAYLAERGTRAKGLVPKVQDLAPALAQDLLRAAFNGVTAYVEGLRSARRLVFTPGGVAVEQTPPDLLNSVLGEAARVLNLPQGASSVVRVYELDRGLEVEVGCL